MSMSSPSTRDDSNPGRWLGSGILPGFAGLAGLAGLAVLVATAACDPHEIKDALAGHGNPPGSTDAAVQPASDGGVPTNPCAATLCPAGTHCEATTVMCIKAPCPPVVGCVANPPSVACGGFAGLACPGAGKCIDDPSDGCDPTKGGADCGGICNCLPLPCPSAAMFDGSPKVCACVPTDGSGGASGGGGGTGSGGTGGGGGSGILKEGESCGGFRPANSPTCAAGLLCQEQAGSLCGAADAPGICVKIPASCPKQAAAPVCGCDGKTYASACVATKALVGILDLGACK